MLPLAHQQISSRVSLSSSSLVAGQDPFHPLARFYTTLTLHAVSCKAGPAIETSNRCCKNHYYLEHFGLNGTSSMRMQTEPARR